MGRVLFGAPRNVQDPKTHHAISLVALLAWIGLGADGLSSSAYGPEEAFKALGEHTYLAPLLALATALTVLVISYAYSRIIEHFPLGGGGYNVASRVLGPSAGVVSGSALVIDYVLTISISIAAGADAIFSFLPRGWGGVQVLGLLPAKLLVELIAIGLLVLLNLRGVKESITILAPIFLAFLATHAVLILGVLVSRLGEVPALVEEVRAGFGRGLQAAPAGLGLAGMAALAMRAYSMGGGTYTGIEAVSNGIQIMREPKVETGKRTMVLMALSLAVTASGLVLAYLLVHAAPVEGKTMNAVLAERFAGGFEIGGVRVGAGFVLAALVSEALLLFVAAQAGFIDGPRVMANMATDSWLPHRFAQLSDRLTMQNGVLLMGGAAALALLYTRGDVTHLVVMYSINVFLTFSLTEAAMCRFWVRGRREHRDWRRKISIHVLGLSMCLTILGVTTWEKFSEGGWVTLALTVGLIGLAAGIRRHYRGVQENLRRLDAILEALPAHPGGPAPALDPKAPTAVLLVGGYGGLGVHALLTVQRTFPGHFRNFIFVSAGVVDSASMKGVEEVDRVRLRTREALERYVDLAHRLHLAADLRMEVGTEATAVAEQLCVAVAKEYPRSVIFAGKLVFQRERWFQRLLHNETAYQLQRRLQFEGLNAMVMPVRVLEPA
jgi:amino acid transporter